jgi:nitrate reductase delta subunit
VIALRRRRRSAATYKLCSLLLSYPDEELLDARRELSGAVGELPASPARSALERFCGWWAGEASLTLQQHYVQTFDLDKRCGLYLTFYGEGERRERGQALLRLKRLYRTAGLPLEGTELPDYLPVMLEFAAAAPSGRGELVLREHRAALELVRISLRERGTPYADVLDAVSDTLGEISAADRAKAIKLAAGGPPQELVGLEPFAPPEVMPSAEPRQ